MADEAQTTEETLDPQIPVTAPEETKTEEAAEQSETSQKETPKEEDQERRRPSKNEQIIAELKRSRDDWKKTANDWYRAAQEKMQTPTPDTKEQPPSSPPPRPKQDQFETYDAYIEAIGDWTENISDWKAEQKVEAKMKAEFERQRIENERIRQEESARTAKQKIDDATKLYPEVNDIVNDNTFPINRDMAQAIVESDYTAEILRYLANNPGESKKIYGMNPVSAIRAIGKIERDVEVSKSNPKPKTKAPDPITPLAGTSHSSVKPLEEMSTEEYVKFRNKQEFGR